MPVKVHRNYHVFVFLNCLQLLIPLITTSYYIVFHLGLVSMALHLKWFKSYCLSVLFRLNMIITVSFFTFIL